MTPQGLEMIIVQVKGEEISMEQEQSTQWMELQIWRLQTQKNQLHSTTKHKTLYTCFGDIEIDSQDLSQFGC